MYSIIKTVKKGGEADMKNQKEELIFFTAIVNMITAIIMLIKSINS